MVASVQSSGTDRDSREDGLKDGVEGRRVDWGSVRSEDLIKVARTRESEREREKREKENQRWMGGDTGCYIIVAGQL